MFIDNTRQNFTELPKQSYASGERLYFTLPKVGLLSKLRLNITGVMTTAAGTGSVALSDRGAWNLIKRIKLIANSGAAIFDVSGYGTFLINNLLKYGHAPDSYVGAVDRTQGAEVFAAPVAEGANNWKLSLEIPIAINDRDPIGLILLQNNATQMVLEVEFNTASGANNTLAPVVVTGNATASFVGTVGVMMEYFTTPRKEEDYPPLNIIHQWLENQDALTSTGAFTKSLLRGDTYMKLIHSLTLANALNTTAVDKLRVLYNQSETPYTVDKISQLSIQRSRYGHDLPKGCYVHDWYYSGGLVNLGTSRDFINSANVTEFQSEVTINSGATVTAGQSFLNTISEKLIRIA